MTVPSIEQTGSGVAPSIEIVPASGPAEIIELIHPGPQGPPGPPGNGSGSSTLAGLSDVNVTAKTEKSLLYYDAASGSWKGDNIQTIIEITNGGNF